MYTLLYHTIYSTTQRGQEVSKAGEMGPATVPKSSVSTTSESSPFIRTTGIAMTNKTLDKHLELTQIALSDTYTGEGLPTVVSPTQWYRL